MRGAQDYDIAVIGGGAAGLAAAFTANSLCARTILIERERLGGECTFTGCVPSKTLIHMARLVHGARLVSPFTSSIGEPTLKFRAAMEHVRKIRQQIYETDDAPANLEKRGIEVVRGRARFTGRHELEITPDDGSPWCVRFRYAIIATGSEPKTIQTTLPCLTNETIFEIDEFPQKLAIAGAGPVGVEMAQAFARLGSRVTVVAPVSRILPKDDEECAMIVQRGLETEGVRFMFGRSVRDYRDDGRRTVSLDDGSTFEADALLAAVGRKSRLDDLGLTLAGVNTEDGQIIYDQHSRTTAKNIFVSGDVAGWYRFTHAAEHMSRVAVTNALLRVPATLDDRMVWTTFTDPEIAHVGETEEQLKDRHAQYDVHRFPYSRIDRAVTDGRTDGLIKIFADKRGRVLGATVAGERAGDTIAEWQLAIRRRISLRELSSTIHAYPTYALGAKRLADDWLAARVSSTIAPLARLLFRYGGR